MSGCFSCLSFFLKNQQEKQVESLALVTGWFLPIYGESYVKKYETEKSVFDEH